MADAIKIYSRARQLLDWNQASFADGQAVRWNATTGKYEGFTPAIDAGLVHTAGNETIGGLKTFTGTLTAPSFAGDGAALTGVIHPGGSYADPSWITSLAGAKIVGSISGNAASITGTITEGQVVNLSSDLAGKQAASATLTSLAGATYATGKLLVGQGTGVPGLVTLGTGLSLVGGTLSATVGVTPGGTTGDLQWNNAGVLAGGGPRWNGTILTATSFTGSGSGLTGLTASQIGAVPTGLLKGASGIFAVATAGTDYLTPTGSGTALTGITATQIGGVPAGLLQGVSGAFTAVTIGTGLSLVGGTLTLVNAVTSVFTRTGAITAQVGDYTVAQVTGAAPLNSPDFAGIPLAPTAAAKTNTRQIATTAFVESEIAGLVASGGGLAIGAPIAGGTVGRVLFEGAGTVLAHDANLTWDGTTFGATAFTGSGAGLTGILESHVTNLVSDLALKAPLASPAFTGAPTALTPATADSSTTLATTAFVKLQGYLVGNQTITLIGNVTGSGTTAITATIGAGQVTNAMLAGNITASKLVGTDIVIVETQVTNLTGDLALKAPLASPFFTGTPQAPTALAIDNSLQIATTAYVKLQGYLVGNQTITLSGDVSGSGTTAITAVIGAGKVTNAMLAGSITASKLVGTDIVIAEGQVTNLGSDLALKAPLASPAFTGAPTALTPATADSSTTLATTAFVKLQGYLVGNQTITLSGDVSGSGTTAITMAIGAGKVTNTMLAGSITASKLVGTDIVIAEGQVTSLTSDLAAKATDALVVHLAGTETITGTKTFSQTITGSISGNAGTVTSGVYTTGSYADPVWLTSLAGSKITGGIAEIQVTNLTTDLAGKQPLNAALTSLAGATYATGTLLGGQGTGVPAVVTVGSGLSLTAGTLKATSTATPPGGATYDIQWNNAGVLAGGGPTWNGTTLTSPGNITTAATITGGYVASIGAGSGYGVYRRNDNLQVWTIYSNTGAFQLYNNVLNQDAIVIDAGSNANFMANMVVAGVFNVQQDHMYLGNSAAGGTSQIHSLAPRHNSLYLELGDGSARYSSYGGHSFQDTSGNTSLFSVPNYLQINGKNPGGTSLAMYGYNLATDSLVNQIVFNNGSTTSGGTEIAAIKAFTSVTDSNRGSLIFYTKRLANDGSAWEAGRFDQNGKLILNGLTTDYALQMGTMGLQSSATNYCWLADNLYNDGAWKYKANGKGAMLYFSGGGAYIYTTGGQSNSTGGPATAPLTQAMGIDATGNVTVAGSLNVSGSITGAWVNSAGANGDLQWKNGSAFAGAGPNWNSASSFLTIPASAPGAGYGGGEIVFINTAPSGTGSNRLATIQSVAGSSQNVGNLAINIKKSASDGNSTRVALFDESGNFTMNGGNITSQQFFTTGSNANYTVVNRTSQGNAWQMASQNGELNFWDYSNSHWGMYINAGSHEAHFDGKIVSDSNGGMDYNFQAGPNGIMGIQSIDLNNCLLGVNLYNNGSAWRYKNNGPGAMLYFSQGSAYFYSTGTSSNSLNGPADAPLTQAMSIGATGNVGITGGLTVNGTTTLNNDLTTNNNITAGYFTSKSASSGYGVNRRDNVNTQAWIIYSGSGSFQVYNTALFLDAMWIDPGSNANFAANMVVAGLLTVNGAGINMAGYNWRISSGGDINWGMSVFNSGGSYHTRVNYSSGSGGDHRAGFYSSGPNQWVAYADDARNFNVANQLNAGKFIGVGTNLDYAFQAGTMGMQAYATNNCWIADNLYFDGAWRYKANGSASSVYFLNGTVQFTIAPSNSTGAGTAASPVTVFIVDASGNLNVTGNITTPGNVIAGRKVSVMASAGSSEFAVNLDSNHGYRWIVISSGLFLQYTTDSWGTATSPFIMDNAGNLALAGNLTVSGTITGASTSLAIGAPISGSTAQAVLFTDSANKLAADAAHTWTPSSTFAKLTSPNFMATGGFYDVNNGYALKQSVLQLGSGMIIKWSGTSNANDPMEVQLNRTAPGVLSISGNNSNGGGTIASPMQGAGLSSSVNDWTPGPALFIRLVPSANLTITGMQKGQPGQVCYIINAGAFTVTFAYYHSGSLAENRFFHWSGTDLNVSGSRILMCIYDNVNPVWRIALLG